MDKKKVIEMCICGSCPSYEDCGKKGGKKEKGFCHNQIGKSKCIKEEVGCICPDCPVTKEMNLKHNYYCTRGSEKEQSK